MFNDLKDVVVVAPHPDDEVLGVGGTIARLSDSGINVKVVLMTRGKDPALTARNRSDALEAHKVLGVAETLFLDFPAAGLDQIAHATLNKALCEVFENWKPETIFLPFPGDIHRDHKEVFESAMVATRPNSSSYPKIVLCYETLSETNWSAPFQLPAFNPNVFLSIEGYLETKTEAFKKFTMQVQQWPHERSVESIEALAKHRGATVFFREAEAFMLVRSINN